MCSFPSLKLPSISLSCLFSLILYCVDTGSDIFVATDLYGKCHYRYFASVLSLVILPGVIYGWFKYFKKYKEDREWKHVLLYLVLYPICFIPMSFWKLVLAVVNNGLKYSSGEEYASSGEEDDAKRCLFFYS